jgi:hypothetical protein
MQRSVVNCSGTEVSTAHIRNIEPCREFQRHAVSKSIAGQKGKNMNKPALYMMFAAAGLSLAACSERTQDAAETTAESAGNDAAAAGAAAGDAVEEGAAAVGNAADKAAATTDELGNKAEQERAEVEAEAHNESVSEAKKD